MLRSLADAVAALMAEPKKAAVILATIASQQKLELLLNTELCMQYGRGLEAKNPLKTGPYALPGFPKARTGTQPTINLTGAMPLNFAAACSDCHVTGLNPAGNASLTHLAFVAGRVCVTQSRRPGKVNDSSLANATQSLTTA